ncbi:MAG: DEAD/DEAH box helicase [Actinomycetota bacterium]|nr:DEAD/DEAH box helicase [Actinomycetota bacterium]
MSGTRLRLRPWQRAALDHYEAGREPDFLAVATPGAGKTTFALTAARMTLPKVSGQLVIVAPTRHLKEQWADASEQFGLHLDADWVPGEGIPADVHGVVTTYQQVGSSPAAIAPLARDGFVILDEIHHAGDERSWGDGIRVAFTDAARRLALSGTPFRSDSQPIPFLRYEAGQVRPDIEYGYGDALSDGRVVRPVFFPSFGGHMEWMAPDGAQVSASFDDPLSRTLANQRLRAALSLDGDWMVSVLDHAHEQLMRLRGRYPEAGGLVIAMDQTHANEIATLLRQRHRVRATVAVSDDPDASEKIAKFGVGTEPWIVAVRMVSEGVDLPRLRVGVYATTTTTELFFRQAVGRIVRWTPGRGSGRAYLFIPDDPRLRHWAESIAEVRRHCLTRSAADEASAADDAAAGPADLDRQHHDDDGQMSLFAVLSATVTDAPAELHVFDDPHADSELTPPDFPSDHQLGEDDRLLIDFLALPRPGSPSPRKTSRRERGRLRRLNTDLARDLAVTTSRSHAAVNAELNRLAGVKKVSEATVEQLQRRADRAEEWLGKERRRARLSRFV